MTKRFLTAIAVLALLVSTATAATILIDGDTLDIDGTRIRLLDIDTPETFRPRCERELVLGLKAKARLRELLDSGPVTFRAAGHDRYGRTLAHVYAGNVDIGARLLKEGHALPYVPGPEAKAQRLATWCQPNRSAK